MKEYILKQLNEGNNLLSSDTEAAYSFFSRALYNAQKCHDLDLQGKALIGLTHASRNMGELGIGFKYAQKSLTLYSSLAESEGMARSYNFLGIFCFHSGLYQNALDHFFKIEKLFSSQQLPHSLILSVYNNIGEVYQNVKAYDSSLSYYKKAFEIASSENLPLYKHSILSNMGKAYTLKGLPEKALSCFRESLDHLEHAGDNLFLGEAHLNLSEVLFITRRIDEGNRHLELAESSLEHMRNTYYFIDILLMKYRYQSCEKTDGLNWLMTALEISKKNNSRKKTMDIYLELSRYHERQGDFTQSLEYYKCYHATESEINASHLKFQLDILLTKHHPDYLDDQLEKLRDLSSHHMDPDSLKRKAHYDELTSLPNRYLIKMMLNHLASSQSKGFLLAILDLDHFKWVNDGMGHLYGDECLIKAASLISKVVQPHNGFVGRYGGEEFLILLTEIDRDKARQILTEVLGLFHVEGIHYHYDQMEYVITASIGAVYAHKPQDDWKKLIDEADHALYQAKAAGRDQLYLFDY